ncbi:Uncharacterized protein TCM_043074 [Theobroma cacao]|uniref:Uncharacterized protein n=1 Tax=Theobroma cacao TaxID=3641 RepID=A0A061FNR0_THECC|nr:Uncharacterized protein TCM_043074 [Theobroma cacao]
MNEVSRGLGLAKAMILLWHRASSDLEAALEGCNTDRWFRSKTFFHKSHKLKVWRSQEKWQRFAAREHPSA